MPPALYY